MILNTSLRGPLTKRPFLTVLFLVAFLLDDAAFGRVLEIVAGGNEGTTRNEGGHLRPRTVGILFEGIAGYLGEACGI
jgi:hypothetical protein